MKARRLAMVGVVLAVCVFAAAASGSHDEERRHVPARDELAHRLAEPVRRVQPGRVLDLRVHLPELIQYDKANRNFAPDFATSWKASNGGKTWTFKTRAGAVWSDGQPLTAADAAWTINTDDQVQGRRNRQLGRTDRPHHARRRADADDARRPLRRGSRKRPRPVPAVPDPAAAHLVAAHGPQGQRPQVVPEQRAGRRRRAVQPDQVPEGPDRALPAQRQVLRPEAEGRRVRVADVLERRRARRRAEAPRHRRDRGRAGDRDQDAAQLRLHRSSRCPASTTPTSSSTRTRRRRSTANCSTRA